MPTNNQNDMPICQQLKISIINEKSSIITSCPPCDQHGWTIAHTISSSSVYISCTHVEPTQGGLYDKTRCIIKYTRVLQSREDYASKSRVTYESNPLKVVYTPNLFPR